MSTIHLPFILDGSTGAMLIKNGMPISACIEEWILRNPEVFIKIQSAYKTAGSDGVYAPTFSANRAKLAGFGLENKVAEINKSLVALSRKAVGTECLVGGNMSPCGMFIAPFGDAAMQQLFEVYLEQAQALEDAGVDFFIIETMITLAEARAALLAVNRVSHKPVFVTCTCDEHGKLLDGTHITTALVVMQALGVDAFGLNCSNGPDEMLENIEALSQLATVPLIAKPNAGLPEMVDGVQVFDMEADEFCQDIDKFFEHGVRIMGGCCGTDHTHISCLAGQMLKYNRDEALQTSPRYSGMAFYGAAQKNAVEYTITTGARGVFQPIESPIFSEPITFDEDYQPEECDILTIEIQTAQNVRDLEENQHIIDKPVCLVGQDEQLLSQALLSFNGVCLYRLGEE